MKGIILAGGSGSRLYPLTTVISKQLLPVYDKPLIFYPLSVLILGGIKDICIITNPEFLNLYKNLLGDGSSYGVRFEYVIQAKPTGLPQAFLLAKNFIGDDEVALILGDNFFYGSELGKLLRQYNKIQGCVIFGSRVTNPTQYGVLAFDSNGNPSKVIEKPAHPPSNVAVTGLYFFDNTVVERASKLKLSERGELEIADLINAYFSDSKVSCNIFNRGMSWLDAGTFDSLLQASNFVQVIEKRQGVKVGCLEEVAYYSGFIDKTKLMDIAAKKPTEYGSYLYDVVAQNSTLLSDIP